MTKLPPYGKPLAELQEKGYHPSNSINLFIGNNAWKKGESFSKEFPERTLILPPWLSPDLYKWPVNECDILIFSRFAEEDYIEELVNCLYAHNAEIVRVIDFIKPLSVYYKE